MNSAISSVIFAALAFVLLGGALAMVTARNVIRAAFALLAVSLASAGLFALLEAHYVALMQVLIYAGAVAILNIFTIMITMRRREDAVRPSDFSVPALLLGASFFVLMTISILGGRISTVAAPEAFPGVAEFGALLFSVDGWSLPFEIASLVLTAALIGAVWWSKSREEV